MSKRRKESKRQKEIRLERERSQRSLLGPSEWWREQIKHGHVEQFPPPAEHAPMIQCESGQRSCNGRFYPGYYVHGSKGHAARIPKLKQKIKSVASIIDMRLDRGADVIELAAQLARLNQRLRDLTPCQCEDCRNNARRAHDNYLWREGLLPLHEQPGEDVPDPIEYTPAAADMPAAGGSFAEVTSELEAMGAARGTVYESELPSEREEDLRRQIEQYNVTKRVLVVFRDNKNHHAGEFEEKPPVIP